MCVEYGRKPVNSTLGSVQNKNGGHFAMPAAITPLVKLYSNFSVIKRKVVSQFEF